MDKAVSVPFWGKKLGEEDGKRGVSLGPEVPESCFHQRNAHG